MRTDITIDGYTFSISTRDPETLARWLAEVFTAVDWTPATYCQARVFPGWVNNGTPSGAADWIADSRIITRHAAVSSPQEFVDMLQAQINDYAELKG